MANAVAKIPFSGSTQGMGIKIAATATLGTTIHTTLTSATVIDEIWLWLFNSDTTDRKVTIEFGDATAPDHNIVHNIIPFNVGLVLALPGLMLTGSGAATLTVSIFADVANKVTATGFVHRITP